MARLFVILALAQLASPAGNLPGPESITPFDSAFVMFERSAEAHANAVRTLASASAPSEAIAAHFTLKAKGDALRAARALLTSSPSQLAKGIRLLVEHLSDFNDDGTSLRGDLITLAGELKQRVSALSVREGADAALELLRLEQGLNMGDQEGNARRQAVFAETYAG
jgi:hypothetical protein